MSIVESMFEFWHRVINIGQFFSFCQLVCVIFTSFVVLYAGRDAPSVSWRCNFDVMSSDVRMMLLDVK